MPQAPTVEVIPRRAAVCRDEPVTLDVLVRITPPAPEVHFPRPAINLALVLDRSGSMAEGKKMAYARQAAVFAAEQLLPTDRVSVTVFDNIVETIAPGGPVTDKPGLVRLLEHVHPRGYTDLHGGWAEGVRQAQAGQLGAGLNRVLLLSDGMANTGVTDPNTITTEVKGKAALGITTTTMGVGEQYNEDLLEAMARAGDGHYYYVETPVQLADIFQTELHGLLATTGQKVSLGIEPAAGITVQDVLNDLQRTPETGRLKLPNLVVGMPVPVLIRLNIPAQLAAEGGPLCRFRLAWDEPSSGPRCVIGFELRPLPALSRAEWDATPEHPAVCEQEAVLNAVRAQLEAGRAWERGDLGASISSLSVARAMATSAPMSPMMTEVLTTLNELQAHIDSGEQAEMIKKAKYGSYARSHGRTDRHQPPPKDQ